MDSDWWRKRDLCRDLIEEFQTRLLGLLLYVKCGDEEKHPLYTGIPVWHENKLFWLTASHVVEEINKLQNDPGISILEMGWWDNCVIPGAESVPLSNRNLRSYAFDDSIVDIGVVHVPNFDAQTILAAGNIKPYVTEFIKVKSAAKPAGYFLMGWSGENVKIDNVASQLSASMSCIPIERLDYSKNRESGEFWDDPSAFYGVVVPFSGEKRIPPFDAKGMSGGPILSIHKDNNEGLSYQLDAVQRSRHPTRKHVIRAEPLEKFF